MLRLGSPHPYRSSRGIDSEGALDGLASWLFNRERKLVEKKSKQTTWNDASRDYDGGRTGQYLLLGDGSYSGY